MAPALLLLLKSIIAPRIAGSLFRKAGAAIRRRREKRKGGAVVKNAGKWLGWVVRLKVIPSGWLTCAAGFAAVVNGGLCLLGASVSGLACPDDPLAWIVGGATAVGFGRRGTK
jgi:hypothetical protein